MTDDEKKDGFDILIPYHGQYKMVRELIGSIILYTRNVPYRITIIDDASPNSEFFYMLAKTDAVDGIRFEEQKGFGAAVNAGIKLTKRPWIVILNSDVIIDELGWLKDLHECLVKLNKSDKVGLVSARSDDPPGNHPLLKVIEKSKRVDVEDRISDQPLPLFCAVTARAMVEKIGFLKEYPYGWYEDEEYHWRMKKYGYKQGISGKAWVRHFGGATVKELWQKHPESKEIMESNRQKCLTDLKKLFGKS